MKVPSHWCACRHVEWGDSISDLCVLTTHTNVIDASHYTTVTKFVWEVSNNDDKLITIVCAKCELWIIWTSTHLKQRRNHWIVHSRCFDWMLRCELRTWYIRLIVYVPSRMRLIFNKLCFTVDDIFSIVFTHICVYIVQLQRFVLFLT